jgi:pyruvate dehydrogenase E2 component (dihydrolipoyllysine-residue acetyltransferase)
MHEVKLPQLGQSVEEAAIVAWLKQEGEDVATGEPLFSVQTDKAEIEVESPAEGVLRKILVQPDLEVPVLTAVALIGTADEDLPDLSQYEAAQPEKAPAAEADTPAEPAAARTVTPAVPVQSAAGPAAAISPRAQRRADLLGVNPALATGSGVGGRVMEADVEALAEKLKAIRITPTARRLAEEKGLDITTLTGTGASGAITKEDVLKAPVGARPAAAHAVPSGEVRTIPLTPMRKIIAQRLSDSMYTAPHYYLTMEIDMGAAMAFREASAFRPSYDAMVICAVSRAVAEAPQVNARWGGDAIQELGDVNVGFAVALPTGLVVPVVRQAQAKTVQAIHADCTALVDKARTNRLTPDDYSGNTLTISNLGVFGVDHFTAIINSPDSAILAIGQIKEKPVVIDGGIHIRPMMNITMSSDHRVIDGAVAAQFMRALRTNLEAADF